MRRRAASIAFFIVGLAVSGAARAHEDEPHEKPPAGDERGEGAKAAHEDERAREAATPGEAHEGPEAAKPGEAHEVKHPAAGAEGHGPATGHQAHEARGEHGKSNAHGAHGEHGEHGATCAAPEHGEHEESEEEEPRFAADVDEVIGQAGSDHRATVGSTVLTFTWHASEHWAISAFAPFVVGSADDVPGSLVAFGDAAFAAAYEAKLGHHTHMPIELLVGLPTAATDDGSRVAFEAASRTRAFELDELFAVQRFSVVPKLEIEHELGRLSLSAYAKVPLLVRAGGAASADVNDVALDFTFAVGARVRVSPDEGPRRGLSLGLRAIGNTFLIEEEKPAAGASPNPFQLVLEPMAESAFGFGAVRIGGLIPIGGRANDLGTWGLRIGVSLFL